jgi:hypothetical protein
LSLIRVEEESNELDQVALDFGLLGVVMEKIFIFWEIKKSQQGIFEEFKMSFQ